MPCCLKGHSKELRPQEKKQNKINERRIEELVNQLGRLEDEIEEKDRALLSTNCLLYTSDAADE